MLVQASLLAVFLGPMVRLEHAVLVVTAAAVFIARAPVGSLRRGAVNRERVILWAAILLVLAGSGALILAFQLPLALVISAVVVAALVAIFNVRRTERSTAAEVTAMLGFALLIPVGVAISGGAWERHGVPIGLLTFLFFATSIPHVRAMVQIRKDAQSAAARRERLLSAVGALCVVGTALAARTAGFLGWLAVAAAALVVARPILSTAVAHRAKPVAIRSVGLIELGLSSAYTALIVVGERA